MEVPGLGAVGLQAGARGGGGQVAAGAGGDGAEQWGPGEPQSQEGELRPQVGLPRNEVQTIEVGGGLLQEMLLAWLLCCN